MFRIDEEHNHITLDALHQDLTVGSLVAYSYLNGGMTQAIMVIDRIFTGKIYGHETIKICCIRPEQQRICDHDTTLPVMRRKVMMVPETESHRLLRIPFEMVNWQPTEPLYQELQAIYQSYWPKP